MQKITSIKFAIDMLILISKCAMSYIDAEFVKVFDNEIEELKTRMYT